MFAPVSGGGAPSGEKVKLESFGTQGRHTYYKLYSSCSRVTKDRTKAIIEAKVQKFKDLESRSNTY